jgi:hypothetical protein
MLVTFFRFYGGFLTKFLIEKGLNPEETYSKRDASTILRIVVLNLVSEMILWPDVYTLKLLTAYIIRSNLLAVIILTLTQVLTLVLVYKLAKRISKRIPNL